MEIQVISDSELAVTGHIKTIDDYLKIKGSLSGLLEKGINSLSIKVIDSVSIPSSLIGYLLKIVLENKKEIRILVKDERLFGLLETLNLVDVLKVKKI
ncbi:hypothetical protein [Candidatus Magnetomonas plexicatena]|uniref:hypothetical protein n=1 Tax=Candidatus Magnetomonas plexicatena TaxID=2552947 RepID=UPI00110232D8|nr:hypothetical protein E2O03_013295 [Nitrospirales bacterium LBB_01]